MSSRDIYELATTKDEADVKGKNMSVGSTANDWLGGHTEAREALKYFVKGQDERMGERHQMFGWSSIQ